uniref:EGF-like domain-containing protein n=1 Tax=Trichuris muris TaxID=70415 RepID=A0A5S6QXU4_TRIMR
MHFIAAIVAFTFCPIGVVLPQEQRCPFEEEHPDFAGGYRKYWGHNYSRSTQCITIIRKGVVSPFSVSKFGVLTAYNNYCLDMEGRVTVFNDAIGLPSERNWFGSEKVRIFSGHEFIRTTDRDWQLFEPGAIPSLPACAKGKQVVCRTLVGRIAAPKTKGTLLMINASACYALMEPFCTSEDPIMSNCTGRDQSCNIDQEIYVLPTCRAFVGTVRDVYQLEPFRHCLDELWDYFACETTISDKWIYRMKRECFFEQSTGTCWMYQCELTNQRLLYRCNWRVKVPCTCPCVDVEWSTWSALSASCGVTVKVRYKPILGQPTSLCTPENSTRCCSEHEQVVLEPCSEYHHGTDILFKQKPCVHGVQVPHLEGGSRCDCMVDYAGMLCNIKIGGSTEKVRQLSAIITNVVIVVCSVLLALAVFMFAKKWARSREENQPKEAMEGAISQMWTANSSMRRSTFDLSGRKLLLLSFLMSLPERRIASTSCPHENGDNDYLGYHTKPTKEDNFPRSVDNGKSYIRRVESFCDTNFKMGILKYFDNSHPLPDNLKWIEPLDRVFPSSIINAKPPVSGCPSEAKCFETNLTTLHMLHNPSNDIVKISYDPLTMQKPVYNCYGVEEDCKYSHDFFAGCLAGSPCFESIMNRSRAGFCRGLRLRTKLKYEPLPMISCDEMPTWKYFACRNAAYSDCVYRKIRGCHYSKEAGKCVTLRYDIIAEAEAPYGRCEKEEPRECICECQTDQWQTWSAWSRTCDTAVRIRYGLKNGVQGKIYYYHGTNVEFRHVPCMHGVHVAHPKGGGRCDCHSGYTGRACESLLSNFGEDKKRMTMIYSFSIVAVLVLMSLVMLLIYRKRRRQCRSRCSSVTPRKGSMGSLMATLSAYSSTRPYSRKPSEATGRR